MGLIKTLLIILFIYYAFKFLVRLFGPFLMKKAVSKMQEKAEKKFGNYQKKADIREGETVIDKKPQKSQINNNHDDDYIDFEEID